MAFYSGLANSLQDLMDALVGHCTAEGWSWSDSILSKENTYVSLSVENVGAFGTQNVIRLIAGKGVLGSTLQNKSPLGVAIGTAITNSNYGMTQFPVEYNLHINSNNEVFLICKYSIDFFHWLAWGDNFIGGTFGVPQTGRFTYNHDRWPMVAIEINRGGSGNQDAPCCAFFWNTDYPNYATPKNYTGSVWDGTNWITSSNAIQSLEPLVARQSSNFFSESVLLPINIGRQVASNKTQILAMVQNARYVRVDNYEPEQIITLGSDKWKIYPFYRKNIQERDGGWFGGADHTGTFGWAIKYDGP